MKTLIAVTCFSMALLTVHGQEIPADYQGVLKTLDKKGDYKSSVLKINIPRNDLKITIDGAATPTPFGFGGWLAMTKGDGGSDVMMGDLVLLEDEVNPVMSALLDNGLEVTALHNHFFFESPRIFYMHVHGHGKPDVLARMAKPAIDLIGHLPAAHEASPVAGKSGGRDDLKLTEMGAKINSRMGLNTWAAFFGTDANAEIAGDVAMLAREVTPVLKALRANGLDVVAIHHHMTTTQPTIYFLHYWGTGPAEKLANGFKAALNELGTGHAKAGKTVGAN